MRKWPTLLAAAALALGTAAAIAVPLVFPTRQAVTAPLETVVPAELAGWTVQTLPIAETEALQAAVDKVLRYDSAIFRSYRRGGLQVTVYAAHWLPEKASLSDVGAHTPDTCWIVAGWQRRAREYGARVTVGDRALLPAEIGRYEKDGVVQHVMFWHLAGGRPIAFDQFGWDERWPARIKRGLSFVGDLARFGLDQRCDQCFVRITCNRPMDEALRDADYQALLRQLAPLGIFAPAA